MFREIRTHFGRGWSAVRERGTLRLFAFEFVVVVLGVLAAQAVQNWAQERGQQSLSREELRRLTAAYYDVHENADVWRKAIPCMRTGVEAILRSAATGEAFDKRFMRRPRLGEANYPPASPDMRRRIVELVGSRREFALEDARVRGEAMWTYERTLLASWEKFRLLDPAYGPVSAADKAEVRTAAIDILTALRNTEIAINNLDEQSVTKQLADPQPHDPTFDSEPAPNCEHIWHNGRIYRDPRIDK